TNYYNQTNYYNFTNYYNTTEIYLKPNTNNISNNAIKNKNFKDESKTNLEYTNETLIDLSEDTFKEDTTIPDIPNEFQNEYDKYNNEYNKALAQFKLGNYSTVITLLKPVSTKNVNRDLYYNINLLLGKAYKYANQKQNALTVFRRIQSINHEEVSFWVNQVLSDL
ncbi:MAG: tetratricopeptide repeat protein, partial [Brachyspira sp.]|nr:tetratricopeptide repeat protein [Brachyspira sp.]